MGKRQRVVLEYGAAVRGLSRLLLIPAMALALGCGPELDLYDGEGPPDVGDEYETDESWDLGKADLVGSWPILRSGQSNRNVVAAQYFLKEHGESLSVDGDFGAETKAAVRSFQQRHELSADGVIGAATWTALTRGMAISLGDEGDHVRALQYLLLNRYRYTLTVNGQFDATTDERTRAFQDDRCLSEDGVVGEDTWFALIAQTGGCGGGGAADILRAHREGRVYLPGPDSEGSSPLDNIEDAAAGGPARRSARGHYGATRVYLKPEMLSAMAQLVNSYGHFWVTSMAGGRHSSASSHHYKGNAFDVGQLRGQLVRGDSAAVREFMRACVALGADQVIGPSGSVSGAWTNAAHQRHIHCGEW